MPPRGHPHVCAAGNQRPASDNTRDTAQPPNAGIALLTAPGTIPAAWRSGAMRRTFRDPLVLLLIAAAAAAAFFAVLVTA